MISAVLAVAVLAANPQVKLAAPGFTAVNADEKLVGLFSDHFAQQLQLGGVNVITKSQIATLIGMERQRQLLGCEDGQVASCLAELAGGLGVDGVITGSIAKVGDNFVINIKIVKASDASAMATVSGKEPTEEASLNWLTAMAPLVLKQLKSAMPDRVFVNLDAGFGPWPYVIGGGGIVLFAAGLGLNFAARGTAGKIAEGIPSAMEVPTLVQQGQTTETVSWVLCGAGVAAIGTGIALLVLGRELEKTTVAVTPMPGGGLMVGFGGALP